MSSEPFLLIKSDTEHRVLFAVDNVYRNVELKAQLLCVCVCVSVCNIILGIVI